MLHILFRTNILFIKSFLIPTDGSKTIRAQVGKGNCMLQVTFSARMESL